jgi:hypothetical protein
VSVNAETANRVALAALLRKLKDGKKPTAADYKFLKEMKSADLDSASNALGQSTDEQKEEWAEPNFGASLEEDLEEWVLRDGVVRGAHKRLSTIFKSQQIEAKVGQRILWKVQRRLLAEYGFEGAKKTGPLEGNEALALQWVKSISQIARASQEWELQMESVARARLGGGKGVSMETFEALVGTLKSLVEKRDGLALKVRELSVKERRASAGKGKRAQSIEIVMGN